MVWEQRYRLKGGAYHTMYEEWCATTDLIDEKYINRGESKGFRCCRGFGK